MEIKSVDAQLSTSICNKTGLTVTTSPEWIVASEKCSIFVSVLGRNIIKFQISGFVDLSSNKKTEIIVNNIIENFIPKHHDHVQILDMSNLEGFSLKAKLNYIKIIKNRKTSIGQIYYNTSTILKLSIRLSRKLNNLRLGIHMVNSYEEAVSIARKLLSSKLPANGFQLDTTRIPFAFNDTTNFCKAIGQPITRKPEWTDINLGDNYSVTFSVYGDNILYSNPKGKATTNSLLKFFEKRKMVIEEAFDSGKPYCEIKNYSTMGIPSKKIRGLFSQQLQESRLIGFFSIYASKSMQFAHNIRARVISPELMIRNCKDLDTALVQANRLLNQYLTTNTIPVNTNPIEADETISPRLLKYYENELLHFIENINWEIHGIDDDLAEIPPSHPFRFIFEAIGLLKSDLDMLSEEREKTNNALWESEKLYRLLAENTDDVIWIADLDLKPVFVSPSITRMSGYSVDYLMTKKINFSLTEEASSYTAELLGAEIEKEASGEYDRHRSILIELEKIRRDGTNYWTEEKISFLRDKEGVPTGLIGVTRNINERKLAETQAKKSRKVLKQTQDQLIQAEKMAALGGLVAGVSHEISTPIGVSVTASSFLHQKAGEFSKLAREGKITQQAIEKFTSIAMESTSLISNNLSRSADLINSFKQVSVDQSTEEKRQFNLRYYIQETLQSLNPQIKRTSHTIQFNCPDDVIIHNYPGAFSQIFTNLIMNSLIHGFEDIPNGMIHIDIYTENGQLIIKYSDNGKGMAKSVLEQLYNPFYTTKRGSGGTGLGMHITYNIITQKLNGLIECTSSVGKGTTFFIKLHY